MKSRKLIIFVNSDERTRCFPFIRTNTSSCSQQKYSFTCFPFLLGQANCIVSLPQKASQDCLLIREEELKKQREIFQLTQRPPFPMPLVNMTILQLSAHNQKDPFERSHFLGYVKMLLKNKAFGKKWIAENPKEMTAFREYEDLFRTFRSTLSSDITGRYYGHRAFRDLVKCKHFNGGIHE